MGFKKAKLTGMARLINSKEKQLKSLEGQLTRLTNVYDEEAAKLKAKIADAKSIISALKKG